jgi:hypothetical protein
VIPIHCEFIDDPDAIERIKNCDYATGESEVQILSPYHLKQWVMVYAIAYFLPEPTLEEIKAC